MKKISHLMIALAATIGLASCSQTDNPTPTIQTNSGSLIIKEINVGTHKKSSTDTGTYQGCQALVIYNNSDQPAILSNWGIAMCAPLTATSNKNIDDNGRLFYESEGWHPALQGIWYFDGSITVAPYSDLVVALTSAIDHTQQTDGALAFDLTDADVACYDIDVYNNANKYLAPTKVPESRWMKAQKYTTANAWPVSILNPALFIFSAPTYVSLAEWLNNEDNLTYVNGDTKQSTANLAAKIPNEWILDGVELFQTTTVDKSIKRLTQDIDAGYGVYNSTLGYSAYRNVDQAATEAIADNAGKLVYGYDQAIEGTSEPSGIDAAASIKNGAKIVYKDSNNSSNDFHLRKDWSLR
ncbi:MAG: DUF4876 domain-containing protein [Prevotella sp.]|nr:DUF4876 domain-containing protein [Prevotella sp.]